MHKHAGRLAKGIGIGVAVGCIAGTAGAMLTKKHKKGIKKSIGKAMRNVSDFMEDVNGMF